MIERVRLLLKSKYGLVHVPSVHKTHRWLEVTRANIAAGQPPEQGGMAAAQRVFPYEFKPYNIHAGATVEQIITESSADA
ncbi:MAG: hypothetical protein ACLFPO_12855 [Spirochaetaceae bacterium]